MTNKKIFRVLALAAFVAMVVIAPLQAAPDCQKKGDQEKKMDKECTMKAEGCMMLKNIPNLSDEQKAKLEKLQAEHQKMMETGKADMEKQAAEMKALMKDPVDVKKVDAKIDEMAKMHADMQKKCLAHCLAVRALLTAEQKAKLGDMGCMGGMGCGMMGACGKDAKEGKCGMKEHGKKMEKGKCNKAKEEKEEEKEEVKK
jgi:Spy/CpxP family protein refolding chaperone